MTWSALKTVGRSRPEITALVFTMREALSDVKRLREMGAESFRIVSQEINLERMVEVFVRALHLVS